MGFVQEEGKVGAPGHLDEDMTGEALVMHDKAIDLSVGHDA
jgi:hypothetical protein